MVSDPANNLYSDSIKKQYSGHLLNKDDLKVKYNDFTDARKNREDGTEPENSIPSSDVVGAIYKEQETCFFGILPILVYFYHVLFPGISFYPDKYPGVFPSIFLDDKVMSEIIFTEYNKGIIVQDEDFNKFSFNSVSNIKDSSVILNTQLETFKHNITELKNKLKEAFLVPIELTVNVNVTENMPDVFSLLPQSDEEPTNYTYLISGGQHTQKIFNDSRDLDCKHGATVSCIEKNSITVKNSCGEGWAENGSRNVPISCLKELSYKEKDFLMFKVILLLPTKHPFQIAQKKLDDFIFLQQQKLGDDENDKKIIVDELNGLIDEIWQKAVDLVNYSFPPDENKNPDDRESDSPSQQNEPDASNEEIDYRKAQEKLNTFLLDLINNNKSEKNEARIRDELYQKTEIIRKKANELFLKSPITS